jgi:hypothetical protein
MAYRTNLLNEQDQKLIAPSTPSSGVFTASAATGTPQGNQAATPSSAPAQGTGFVNLEQYLGANKGVGMGLASTVAGQAKEAEFGAELSKTTGGYSQAATQSQQASAKKAEELSKGLGEKPMETVQAAGEFIGESYAGPTADPYQAQAKATQQAQAQRLERLGTDIGQQQALQEAFSGQQGYGSGFSQLDQFLLAANPQARGNLQAKQTEQKQRMSEAGQAAQKTLSEQQKAVQETFKKQQEAVRATAKEQLAQRKGETEKQIAAKAAEEAAREKAFAERTSEQGKRIVDKIWQAGQGASYADILTPEQIADIEALSGLTGEKFDQAQKEKRYRQGTGSYTVKV